MCHTVGPCWLSILNRGLHSIYFLLEEVAGRMWPPAEPQTGPRQSEAPHLLPWPGMYEPATIPIVGTIFKDRARESNVLLGPYGLYDELNPVKSST